MSRRPALVRSSRNRSKAFQGEARNSAGVKFVICIDNDGYPVDLEVGKVYRLLPDPQGKAHGLVRVIDYSGEDHLYSTDHFVPMRLPQPERRTWLRTS